MPRRRKAEVDLAHLNEPEKVPSYEDGSTGINLPMDMPAYMRAYRLVTPTPEHNPPAMFSEATVGHTLEIDFFTRGVKIYIRAGKDGTLKVFAEDSEGTVKLEEWEQ